jgi:hypothetical protein
MKQITPQIYAWSHQPAQRRGEVDGHFLQRSGGEAGILSNPVPLGEDNEAHVRERGGVQAVLLGGPARAHDASRYADIFGCALLAPRPVERALQAQGAPAVGPFDGQRAEGTAFGKSRRFFLPERVNVGYWEGTQTD